MNQQIIGIIGEIAAGKDTAADYMGQMTGLPVYALSDFVRQQARERNLPLDRDSLIRLTFDITAEHGTEYLTKIFLETVKESAIVTGMRQVGQIKYLENHSKLFLIGITAEPATRFQRTQIREKLGDGSTYEKFLIQQKSDSQNQLQDIVKCLTMANIVIENDTTQEDLFQKLDSILERYFPHQIQVTKQ